MNSNKNTEDVRSDMEQVTRIRLLVVEDEPPHVEAILRAMWSSEVEFDVEVVGTLREYGEVVALRPPDVALLDLNLPDGRATERLTLPDARGHFPVLIMTSYGDERTAVESLKAGAFDYVVKSPEAFAAIPRIIEGALREWRLLEEHRQYEAELAAIYENAPFIMLLADEDRTVRKANDLASRLAGLPVESMKGLTVGEVFRCASAQAGREGCGSAVGCSDCAVRLAIHNTLESGTPSRQLEVSLKVGTGADAREAVFLLFTTPFVAGTTRRVLISVVDITERKLIEANLQQTQKMESVGRLAGGVAHDFNNLLTVINGYSSLLLETVDLGSPNRLPLEEIHRAGERAAGLTRQLLAYSRKQLMQLRVMELDRTVLEMHPMLARLVGEDVALQLDLQADGGMVLADPHQVEQAVMNLVVNARDAMPRGGNLAIRTRCMEWDESQAWTQQDAKAGRYVMVEVSDDGMGMNAETRRHIFEPFFTTKEVGKGTGLGLSMVHGIVAQSGGYVKVQSEPGHGARFAIYLPRVTEPEVRRVEAPRPAIGGTETILVVEDQTEVRDYVTTALRVYGYTVLAAGSGSEALLLCEREGTRIDLILTDVVMPSMSGRELAASMAARWPAVKVLYMSGYSDDRIANHGVLESGSELIQKPFGPDQLARHVRAVLGT